jgi:hypothetical protein
MNKKGKAGLDGMIAEAACDLESEISAKGL